MNTLLRRVLIGAALAVVVYVVAVVLVEADRVHDALRQFDFRYLLAALGLSSLNYLLRFWKWELCLGWLRVRDDAPGLSIGRSLVIYLAGLSMSITPGKVGEVLRSVLLKASDKIAFSRTAPVVIADRATDLVALVLLTLVGISGHREYLPVVVVTSVLVLGGVSVLGSPRLLSATLHAAEKLPRVGSVFTRAHGMVESSAVVLRWDRLTILSVISVAGWGLECVGFHLILQGFPGVSADLALSTFLWAVTTLIGALSFLPGGLGATEGSLALLVTSLAVGVTPSVAVAATLLIRGATLWYGELVGGAALAIFLRDPAVRARAEVAADDSISRE